jgi:hypothetical protein
MNRHAPLLLACSLLLFLLPGCNHKAHTTPTVFSSQKIAGNWSFTPTDAAVLSGYPFGPFVGSISGQGEHVSAILRSSRCLPSSQDITFTGHETAAGMLTLVSTSLPRNVITLSAEIPFTGGEQPSGIGAVSISGPGPCTLSFPGTLLASRYPVLTGSFNSVLTADDTTAAFTAAMTQGAAAPDGHFPVSGTFTLRTLVPPECSSTYALNGTVNGPQFSARLTSTSGKPSTGTIAATLAAQAPQVPFTLNLDTGCLDDSLNGYFAVEPAL